MKKIFLLSLAIMLFGSFSFATIRRVGFFGTPVTNVDYSALQAAHDAATSGDTIIMMPGSAVYGNITKTLVIIGPGYFLDPANTLNPGNTGLQANLNSNGSINFPLVFQAGSSNSQVIGCFIFGFVQYNGSNLNNIIIKRCWFNSSVLFYANASNLTFQQCVFSNLVQPSAAGSFAVSNLSFLNCLFDGSAAIRSLNSSYPNFSFTGLISNCVFSSTSFQTDFGTGAWQVQNTISQALTFTGTNIVYNNNIGTGTQFPIGNGNQQNKAWATIFNLTGSYDGKYTLKSGSPAIGAGVGGIDAGIFGGATPYRLSGIPPVPTIYQLSSPQGTTPAGNTVQINLSTRSNN